MSDGLWGIAFGGNTLDNGSANALYFTAGPNDGQHGLFGFLLAAPDNATDHTERQSRTKTVLPFVLLPVSSWRNRFDCPYTLGVPSNSEQRAYDELTAWTLSLRDSDFIHQHVVDAWAAQHADENSRPIGIAFALIGLYLHLEQGYSGREVQRAHMQLAQPHGRGPGRKEWPRFSLPVDRGTVTVCDVMAVPEHERARLIDEWCRSVWSAWHNSHAAVIADLTDTTPKFC